MTCTIDRSQKKCWLKQLNCVECDVALWLTFAFCPKWSNSQKQASSHARELRLYRRSVASDIWPSTTSSLYVRVSSTATRKAPVEAYTFYIKIRNTYVSYLFLYFINCPTCISAIKSTSGSRYTNLVVSTVRSLSTISLLFQENL